MNHRPIRSKDRFLVFGAPTIGDEEVKEVLACIDSRWLGTGPRVARFEHEFGAYKDAPHALAVSSCTAALHLSMLAAGVGPGDEVITTAMTFCSTVNAIVHAGAKPVLADIDMQSMNIDPQDVARRITTRTKAILPVHFAGRACDMDALLALAGKHDLKVIEDCAHAVETTHRGRKAGTLGDFGCFSFYATKNVTTGEGGMVLAKQESDAACIKILALHGMSHDAWKRFGDEGYRHYYAVACGFKYNMMDLQAALGIHQLRRVHANWLRRQEIWGRYQDELAGLPLALPADAEEGSAHAYHLYTVLVDDPAAADGSQVTPGRRRDALVEALTREGIGVGVHYLSIPEHPYFAETFGWSMDDYPHARDVGHRTLSLPLSPGLSDDDVGDVIAAVRRVVGR